MLGGATVLSSCALPRNQAEVMHGAVLGGPVPLYKTGSIGEFFKAGLVLPDVGGYVRAEFDVLNIGSDGLVNPSKGGGKGSTKTVAQLALPRKISSYDLSGTNCEMRAAVPSTNPATSPAAAPPAAAPLIAAARPPAAPARAVPKAALPVAPTVTPAAAPAVSGYGRELVDSLWTSNQCLAAVAVAELRNATAPPPQIVSASPVHGNADSYLRLVNLAIESSSQAN